MPEEQGQQEQQRPSTNNQFTAGLNKDVTETVMKPGQYTHARNGTSVLPDGHTGLALHTEPANRAEVVIPYTLIGRIQLVADQWILFSTNNVVSEIGLYVETQGTYTTMLNDQVTITTINPATGTFYPGLNFSTSNLITGVARRNFDCGFDVYWSDGRRNPDRMLDTAYLYPNPWVQSCVTIAACITCTNTNIIDTNAIRLAPQFSVPCLVLAKSTNSGLLLNGSYQICIRFAINGISCTDFVALSNVMGIFSHDNQAGALTLSISGISDETTVIFPELEVVVISMVNFQVQAKRLGIYNSNQSTIHIDNLAQELINIDLKLLPLSTPIIDSCDAIYSVSNYLMRVGTSEKPEFNYQPLANQIVAHWACFEYPDIYYHNGGSNGFPMNVGYLRDEVYSLYIRWVYTTGDKSASYHIPGLPGGTSPTLSIAGFGTVQPDGSVIVATGRFGGYSSTETYPDNEADIWGALCGQPVMHHKFPDADLYPTLSHYVNYGTSANPDNFIHIMGMWFDNIQSPIDNNGNIIPNIQGYEILRDVRNGNESILAKGMVNNMRTYTDSAGQQGLFQNYPYNDLSPDVYLTNNVNAINTGTPGPGGNGVKRLTGWRDDILSFHSPDTVFQHPYLGTGSLKIVMGMSGNTHGQFEQPYKHPLFKVLTNFDSAIGGVISAVAILLDFLAILGGGGIDMSLGPTQELPMNIPLGLSAVADGSYGSTSDIVYYGTLAAQAIFAVAFAPIEFVVIQQQISNVIKGLIPGRQYAAQYNSSGFYNTPVFGVGSSGTSYAIEDYSYIRGQIQTFQDLTINNIYRNNYVALQLAAGINSSFSQTGDNSRYNANGGTLSFNWDSSHTIASYYASYNVVQGAQYGQVGSCKQVLICCMQQVTPVAAPQTFTSAFMFGGDTYINRYTEKNPFMFFNDWLVNVPEDFIYDYRNYINVPYPIFWINNDVVNYSLLGLASNNRRLDGPINSFTSLSSLLTGANASIFYVKTGYFYLFCNGVRDFYVESSVNVGYRDWGDPIQEQFYNPYGITQDINQLFRSDIIKSEQVYKYDYSLSADKFWNQYLSWGQCLDRDYNPILAYSCFAYYPRRIAYSLPQEEEIRKDNWKVFLPNNYKDMPTKVTAIKDINKTGALILLDDQAPQSFQGVESIQSNTGTAYTTGSGSLFSQPLQSVTNVDDSYQYGSCQNRLAILSTPYGVFWASQNTGKIFLFAPSKTYYNKGEAIIDITDKGLKYWFAKYLPSQLLTLFPTYVLADNPVAGVGIQMIYDNVTGFVYICKKDYTVNPGVQVTYANGNFYGGCPPGTTQGPFNPATGQFTCVKCEGGAFNGNCPGTIIQLGDPNYFTDCSWTVSYDPEKQQWVSYHDWCPALNIQAKTHFLTTNNQFGTTNVGDTLWRHNTATGLFCNYYGIQYPFELEYPLITGSNVTTLESIEVFMESYLYNIDQVDRFHNYDAFFDFALIYNSEQSTQPLLMQLKSWDQPFQSLAFPIQTAPGLEIYYTKQEQKYRIGFIKDFTNDRGEFDLSTQQLFLTAPNGYTWQINPMYLNINKNVTQLKKIRHFKSRIFLRKNNPGPWSMSVYFASTKNLNSSR